MKTNSPSTFLFFSLLLRLSPHSLPARLSPFHPLSDPHDPSPSLHSLHSSIPPSIPLFLFPFLSISPFLSHLSLSHSHTTHRPGTCNKHIHALLPIMRSDLCLQPQPQQATPPRCQTQSGRPRRALETSSACRRTSCFPLFAPSIQALPHSGRYPKTSTRCKTNRAACSATRAPGAHADRSNDK